MCTQKIPSSIDQSSSLLPAFYMITNKHHELSVEKVIINSWAIDHVFANCAYFSTYKKYHHEFYSNWFWKNTQNIQVQKYCVIFGISRQSRSNLDYEKRLLGTIIGTQSLKYYSSYQKKSRSISPTALYSIKDQPSWESFWSG